MTSSEVKALIQAEIAGRREIPNSHGVELSECLVEPRQIQCRDASPDPVELTGMWLVLEETPGQKSGYLVVYDERKKDFGLAVWDGDTAVHIGYHGSFLDTLKGM